MAGLPQVLHIGGSKEELLAARQAAELQFQEQPTINNMVLLVEASNAPNLRINVKWLYKKGACSPPGPHSSSGRAGPGHNVPW